MNKFAIQHICDSGSNKLSQPHSMPYTICSDEFCKYECDRKDNNHISHQRDDKGWEAFSESFECTGDGDRNRRDDKANANNAKSRSAKANRFCIRGEKSDQGAWNSKTKCSTDYHDTRYKNQRIKKNLPYTGMFTCTIIVANQRTHSLNNTISSQIKEGLELIVGTKNKHIRLGICSQNSI